MTKILLLFGVLLACIAAGPASQPAVPDDAGKISLPSFGISATSPKGWIRMAERNETTAIKWIKLADAQAKSPAILQIEIQPKLTPTLEVFVDALASKNHATVSDPNAKMGDERAIEFKADAAAPQKGDAHLIAGRVAEHGGYIYGLYLIGPSGTSEPDALSSVSAGIKWLDLAAPADCLAARSASRPIPFTLFDTGISYALPDPFRFSKAVSGREYYVAYNLANQSIETMLEIRKAATGGFPLEQVEALAAKQAGCAASPTWTTLSSNPNVAYSAVAARGPGKDGAPQGPVQLIVIITPKETYGLLTFSYSSEESEPKYGAAIVDIAKSVSAAGAVVTEHQKIGGAADSK